MAQLDTNASPAESAIVFRLTLFFAGDELNSRAARENLEKLCQGDLEGRCEIEYVDVLEDFEEALKHNVLVTPTLLVREPQPEVTIIGNLSDESRVRKALGLGER